MKVVINRDELLGPLLHIGGVVERRQTLPILANLLMNVQQNSLSVTATDLEIEIKTSVPVTCIDESSFTLPARKLIDICRALPEGIDINFQLQDERVTLRAGKSRFTLSTLPAQDYPVIEPLVTTQMLQLKESVLKQLIDRTQFAMAIQDVRYYLNGLLLDVSEGVIRAVATDGHRLAVSEANANIDTETRLQVIVPRKAVLELGKLLDDSERDINIALSSNHIRLLLGETVFTSKLIDGQFPDFERVIPKQIDREIVLDKESLRQALARTSILSNEKYRGIRFKLTPNQLQLLAHNPEQEEAEEQLDVDYSGEDVTIGFNVGYLLDILAAISDKEVKMEFSDAGSSMLMTGVNTTSTRYVVMPMRL